MIFCMFFAGYVETCRSVRYCVCFFLGVFWQICDTPAASLEMIFFFGGWKIWNSNPSHAARSLRGNPGEEAVHISMMPTAASGSLSMAISGSAHQCAILKIWIWRSEDGSAPVRMRGRRWMRSFEDQEGTWSSWRTAKNPWDHVGVREDGVYRVVYPKMTNPRERMVWWARKKSWGYITWGLASILTQIHVAA